MINMLNSNDIETRNEIRIFSITIFKMTFKDLK